MYIHLSKEAWYHNLFTHLRRPSHSWGDFCAADDASKTLYIYIYVCVCRRQKIVWGVVIHPMMGILTRAVNIYVYVYIYIYICIYYLYIYIYVYIYIYMYVYIYICVGIIRVYIYIITNWWPSPNIGKVLTMAVIICVLPEDSISLGFYPRHTWNIPTYGIIWGINHGSNSWDANSRPSVFPKSFMTSKMARTAAISDWFGATTSGNRPLTGWPQCSVSGSHRQPRYQMPASIFPGSLPVCSIYNITYIYILLLLLLLLLLLSLLLLLLLLLLCFIIII